MIGSVWRAMNAPRWELALAALVGALASASAVALLGTSAWLITFAAQLPPVLSLSVAAVLVRTFALSRSVGRYVERLIGHDAAFRGLTNLRVRIYESLERVAPVGLARFSRGDLVSRLVGDVDAILDLPLRVLLPWAQAVLVSAGAAAFVWWIQPSGGALLAIALGVGIVVVPWVVALRTRKAERRIAPTRGAMSARVTVDLQAAAELATFGAADRAVEEVRELDRQLTSIARRESAGLAVGSALGVLVQGATVVGMLLLTIPAVVSGQLDPVWCAVAVLLPIAAYDVVANLPSSALAMQRVRASALRIAEILASEQTDSSGTFACPSGSLTLRLEGASARWSADSAPTLRGVAFTVEPGARAAIVGPSGSGKSTLASVLMGFLAYEGSVTAGGVEIRDLDADDWRTRIGILSQQSHIFDTTIGANLRIARSDASDDELRDVLVRVRLDHWLDSLPDGLATVIRGNGETMSGGERQRLAMARLLLAKRDILILDEPTEHLDPEVADELAADLLAAASGHSTLLITHRARDLTHVDRIHVMMGGRIEASGSHEHLLRESQWYAERWALDTDYADLAAVMRDIPAGTATRIIREG